jgi:hypothetical protein
MGNVGYAARLLARGQCQIVQNLRDVFAISLLKAKSN